MVTEPDPLEALEASELGLQHPDLQQEHARSAEFRHLVKEYLDTRSADYRLEAPAAFRGEGGRYPSPRIIPPTERYIVLERRQKALEAVRKYCERKGLPYPSF